MLDVLKETLIDSIKLLPFLFLAFLIIEAFEHTFNKKVKKTISKSGKFGPLIGSSLGLVPQCGFSVLATNLYVTRILSLGTLIAIYLSTSDEMIPVLLSSDVSGMTIVKILVVKFVVGLVAGFVIDFLLRNKKKEKYNYEICSHEECHCEDGILMSSLEHTLNTLLFIFIASFVLNEIIYFIGEDNISKIFLKDNIFAPLLSSFIGLIPNCASSVIITELYIKGAISIGTTLSGLLTGSGVALLVLFKTNKNTKENLTILATIYGIGASIGMLIEIVRIIF